MSLLQSLDRPRQPRPRTLCYRTLTFGMATTHRLFPAIAASIGLGACLLVLQACSAARAPAITLDPTYSILRDQPERAARYTIEADPILAPMLSRAPDGVERSAARAPALP